MTRGKLWLAPVLLCAAAPAWADIGPTWVVGIMFFWIGNPILGLIEGALVSWWAKVRYRRAAAVMIAANLFSAAVGVPVVQHFATAAQRTVPAETWFYGYGTIQLRFLIAAYILTVVLEWPFVWFAGWPARARPARAGVISLAVQAVTYAALWVPMLKAGNTSIFRDFDCHARPADVARLPGWIYYQATDGNVHRIRLDGTRDERAFRLDGSWAPTSRPEGFSPWQDWWPNLEARASENGRGVSLWVVDRTRQVELATSIPGQATPLPDDPFMSLAPVPDLRPAAQRGTTFRCGGWSTDGIWVNGPGASSTYYLGVGTVLADWPIRNATVLPGDVLVFQMGPHLLTVDWPRRLAARIATGRNPVVVLDPPPAVP